MQLIELIDEYKKMTKICDSTNYSDKRSVTSNNKAVGRMYQIVNTIKTEFGEIGIYEFAKLINCKEDRTNIWAAVQMLEKMQVDNVTEQKALAIIKQEANQSLGMEYWLKAFEEKKDNRIGYI